jgi:hypothetical protein
MEMTSLLETGFSLDDLRVEELEPRLEFSQQIELCAFSCCNDVYVNTTTGEMRFEGCPGLAS